MQVIIESAWRAAIIAELQARGMSRSEFARLLGCGPQNVTEYLNGRRTPGADVMERWLHALNLRPVLTFEREPAAV